MSDVIPSLDSVTPAWLTSILRQNGVLERGRVLDVNIRSIPAFNSVVAHLEPVYTADIPAGVPERLFIKIKQHHWGRDEVAFHRLVSGQKLPPPMLIPLIDGAYDEDTGVSHCLMHDVSKTHHAPVSRERILAGDGVPEEGELAGCFGALAGLHAYWWEHPVLRDGPVRIPLPFRDEDRYMAEVRQQAEGWRRFRKTAGGELPRELLELYDSRIEALPTLWGRSFRSRFDSLRQLTACHSDCYFTQFLCPDDPSVHGTYLTDMEEVCVCLGAEDLVYLIATFWTREQRRENDREIRCLMRYHESLVKHGIENYSWDDLCRDYRLLLIWRVHLPVWDQVNGSTRDYWRPKMQCLADAYRDWNCAALL